MLGSGQPDAEDRFLGLLDRVAARPASGLVAQWGSPAGGHRAPGADRRGHGGELRWLLLGGGFGGGKSHLLTHFGQAAAAWTSSRRW